jgi:hypothetical protein
MIAVEDIGPYWFLAFADNTETRRAEIDLPGTS